MPVGAQEGNSITALQSQCLEAGRKAGTAIGEFSVGEGAFVIDHREPCPEAATSVFEWVGQGDHAGRATLKSPGSCGSDFSHSQRANT